MTGQIMEEVEASELILPKRFKYIWTRVIISLKFANNGTLGEINEVHREE